MQLFYLWTIEIIVLSAVVIPVLTAPIASKEDVLRPKTLTLPTTDAQDKENDRAGELEQKKQARSNSFSEHILNNLQNSNQIVYLASLPHGIPPPDDGEEVPILNYAFVNLTPERPIPHWTETLHRFQNHPLIKNKPELQNKLKPIVKLQSLIKNNPDFEDHFKATTTELHPLIIQNNPVLQDSFNPIVQGPHKIYGDGSESKFPLIIEYFVQRIQNYFSHYVYEDMSRPPPYDADSNLNDNMNVSVVKEEQTTVKPTDDMDFIVDLTMQPNLEISAVTSNSTNNDFDEVTEEWEEGVEEDNDSPQSNITTESPKVVVQKETLYLKLVQPIQLEDDAFIYVGDGTGEELDRSSKNHHPEKKVQSHRNHKKTS